MKLPEDPSKQRRVRNEKRRGSGESLESQSCYEDLDKEELLRRLSEAGFEYDKERNCFR